MTTPIKQLIKDGTLHELSRVGIVPITVLTKIYIWERVQTVMDENPNDNKMKSVQKVALECRVDDSTVLRAYNYVSKIV